METVRSSQWFGDLADDFYIVCDKETDRLYSKFWSSGVPANVFIDQGGYIFEIAGALTEEHFEEILYYNLSAKVA